MRINECSCGCGGASDKCMKERGSNLNYMFFGNLETLKRMIDDLLEMNEEEVDNILKDGHDWAVDHIASSLDDVQEVYNFIKTNSSNDHRKEDSFAEEGMFVKTFENYLLTESKKKDQDGDGDTDFADVKIAQYMAGGIDKKKAIKRSRKFNK